jgi:hypothetical protein
MQVNVVIIYLVPIGEINYIYNTEKVKNEIVKS